MGRTKGKVIILALVIVIIISLGLISYGKENKANGNKKDNVELLFADNYISSIIKGDSMSFNIFGVRKVEDGKKKPLISDVISDVDFNNENIKIKSFSVDEGLISNGFQLLNFIIDLEVSGENIEKADQFIVYFNNNAMKSYTIGDITLQNDRGYQNEDINHGRELTVGYPTPSLDMDIINNSEDIVTLHTISDLNKGLNYNFSEHTDLKYQESFHISIPSFEQKKAFDFYTVTPILQYSKDGQEYYYDIPDVIYGILIPDEEKIQRIIH